MASHLIPASLLRSLWTCRGTVDGHQIHTQLLGGHLVDHIGAVRVVSIADKRIVEKLTVLDSQTMTM